MAKTSTAERTRRLIALLGRLTNGVRLPIAELATAVGATPAELAADLETLAMCGVAPYDPYASVPVMVEDGYVEVYGDMPAPTGTIRLSAPQAAALVAALQAVGFTSGDALTDKLLSAASADFDAADLEHTLRSTIATHDDATYQRLALAEQTHTVMRIEHAAAGTDVITSRDIEPVALFAERGAWYVTAFCRSAGDWRTFRLDRIRSAKRTGAKFTPRADRPTASGAFDGSDLPVATLRFAAGERFIEREWPGGRIVSQDEDGTTIAEVPFGGTGWLARHIVARLGAVEVVAPENVRAAARELAASLVPVASV